MTYYERAVIKRRRREIEVKRNIILLLAAITIVLFAAIVVKTTIPSIASDDSHVVYYKYFKSIEIEAGDTLWSIANEYIEPSQYSDISEYIKEVKAMNSLKSSSIKAGSYLIIPYFSTDFIQN